MLTGTKGICQSSPVLSAHTHKKDGFPAFVGLNGTRSLCCGDRGDKNSLRNTCMCASSVVQKGAARSVLAGMVEKVFMLDNKVDL